MVDASTSRTMGKNPRLQVRVVAATMMETVGLGWTTTYAQNDTMHMCVYYRIRCTVHANQTCVCISYVS